MKPLVETAGLNNKLTSKNSARQLFMSAALGMSWQLAIAVLVPVIGGYELDKALKTLPLFTLVGLILAMGLSSWVVLRALKTFQKYDRRKAQ
jgi:F0F1-type ATP synthase assembly protein I